MAASAPGWNCEPIFGSGSRPEDERDRRWNDAADAGSRYGPPMNVAALSLPQRLRLPPRRMWVLPVILAAFVQVDIWGGRLALGHMVGPRPVVALLYAVTSLSLIWCRRAPLAVLAFIVTADSAVYLVFGAPEGLGSFLPVLIAFYAVGRYSEPGNVVFAAPLVFVGIAIHELTDPVYSFGGSDRSSMRCSRQAGRLGTPSGGVQWRMRPFSRHSRKRPRRP